MKLTLSIIPTSRTSFLWHLHESPKKVDLKQVKPATEAIQ